MKEHRRVDRWWRPCSARGAAVQANAEHKNKRARQGQLVAAATLHARGCNTSYLSTFACHGVICPFHDPIPRQPRWANVGYRVCTIRANKSELCYRMPSGILAQQARCQAKIVHAANKLAAQCTPKQNIKTKDHECPLVAAAMLRTRGNSASHHKHKN